MDAELMCNIRKCHKRLENSAWVTSCSHVFCDDCANTEFNKALACPACQEKLPMKYDLVRVDLQPCEPHKSMILAGLKPDTIMEICCRAISFWNYQVCQELSYLASCCSKAREKRVLLEQTCTQLIDHAQAEIMAMKSQASADRKEIESCKQKISEMAEKLAEKSRQHQRLQSMYDALRRQCISSNYKCQNDAAAVQLDSVNNRITEPFFNRAHEMFSRTSSGAKEGTGNCARPSSNQLLMSPRLKSPARRDTGLRGTLTPLSNSLQFHKFQPDTRKVLPSPRDSARRQKLF